MNELREHPRPWTVSTCGHLCWEVVDANGHTIFDDGSAGGEYPARCSKEARDFIVGLVNLRALEEAGVEV